MVSIPIATLGQVTPDWFPCYGEVLQSNPIVNGTCDCGSHLWLADGCQEGYFCYDTSGFGCYMVSGYLTMTKNNKYSYGFFRNAQWALF